MAYADYTFYISEYLGKAVPEVDFDRIAARASAYLDYITDDKAQRIEYAERVGLACCAVCDELYQEEQNGGGTIQSEKVGEWSVTYAGREITAYKMYKAAYIYLYNTGLLYRGVYDI